MAGVLTDLLRAGLIEKLEGDDKRFTKMEKAAKVMAEELAGDLPQLIRAILAALDPDVPANDPAIAQAERALAAEWKAMRSVHTSPPIGLFRAILLDACSRCEGTDSSAIVWLTAVDTLPLMRLGKEESTVRGTMESLAKRTEEAALSAPALPSSVDKLQNLLDVGTSTIKSMSLPQINRPDLLTRVAASVGPVYRNRKLEGANPHWAASRYDDSISQAWAWEFSDRMSSAIGDYLDVVLSEVGKLGAAVAKQSQSFQIELSKSLTQTLGAQRKWVVETIDASEAHRQNDLLRLNALWWSEALYSPSLHCSYRELPIPLAPIVMAIDLLDAVMALTPASVAYLLAETVHRLPGADFTGEHLLADVLGKLREARCRLPGDWIGALGDPPADGRLSLRDLIVVALGDRELDPQKLMKRAGLQQDIKLSLPVLARALFRQEQAVRLAQSDR